MICQSTFSTCKFVKYIPVTPTSLHRSRMWGASYKCRKEKKWSRIKRSRVERLKFLGLCMLCVIRGCREICVIKTTRFLIFVLGALGLNRLLPAPSSQVLGHCQKAEGLGGKQAPCGELAVIRSTPLFASLRSRTGHRRVCAPVRFPGLQDFLLLQSSQAGLW